MHTEISVHVPDLVRSNTTLICRTGNIADPVDLERCRPDLARSIIVVDPTREDAPVVRALLALLHSATAPRDGIPIVAEIDDPATAEAMELAFDKRVTVVKPDDVHRPHRRPGLPAPAGVAHTLPRSARLPRLGALRAGRRRDRRPPLRRPAAVLPRASLIGVVHGDDDADLNPDMDTLIAAGQSCSWWRPTSRCRTWLRTARCRPPWTRRATSRRPSTSSSSAGTSSARSSWASSTASCRATRRSPWWPTRSSPLRRERAAGHLTNAELELREAQGVGYAALVDVIAERKADHAMVLCYENGLSVAEADARALVTTLQVRRAIDHHGHDTTVVTELLDQRDVALAPPTAAGDFLVSDRLISLLLAQLSEDAVLTSVFDDLLDPGRRRGLLQAGRQLLHARRRRPVRRPGEGGPAPWRVGPRLPAARPGQRRRARLRRRREPPQRRPSSPSAPPTRSSSSPKTIDRVFDRNKTTLRWSCAGRLRRTGSLRFATSGRTAGRGGRNRCPLPHPRRMRR